MAMGSMDQGMTDQAWVVPMADKRPDPSIDDDNNDEDQGSTDEDEADGKAKRKWLVLLSVTPLYNGL